MPPSALVAALCAGCGTEFAPALLSCPACHRLTHADALERLAAQAEQAEQSSDRAAALCLWREALPLIPPGSKQHEAVAAKVQALGRASWTRRAGPAGAIGLVLWKAKLALVLLLGKAKVLLLGLTKVSTLATMLLSLGVYWTAWGWKFALGVVVSIYVHEIGHVAALQRLGIRASAPMFVPGFGAFVRLEQHPTTEAEDAHVGLAGPLWDWAPRWSPTPPSWPPGRERSRPSRSGARASTSSTCFPSGSSTAAAGSTPSRARSAGSWWPPSPRSGC